MNLKRWKLTKAGAFKVMMVAAAAACLLPASWTSCLNGLMQPMSPVSGVVREGVRGMGELADDLAEPVLSPEEVEILVRENERLALQVAHQTAMLAEMEGVIDDLTGVRGQLSLGNARIIFSKVIGGESSPTRETVLISKGARQGIRVGDWVVSGSTDEERKPEDSGLQLVMQQWLIGVVADVQPYVSRVQLTTDPSFTMNTKCRAGRYGEGSDLEFAEEECRLEGVGGGRMRIDQSYRDYFSEGYDVVLAPLPRLGPIPLTVGRIVRSRALETGLHFEQEVMPWGAARDLSNVYVISLDD